MMMRRAAATQCARCTGGCAAIKRHSAAARISNILFEHSNKWLRVQMQGHELDLANAVPQSQPLNERQVPNNAGGYTFQASLVVL